jgi:hypothetical protein
MIKSLLLLLLLLLLFFQTPLVFAEKTYNGYGEATIVNITPQQARVKSREQALLDILQQVTGIEIASQQLVVNATMASYHILQTRSARVVNSHCDYRVTQSQDQLTQIAQCTGSVQTFGRQSPDISGALVALGVKNTCQFTVTEMNAVSIGHSLFKSNQRFCLLLNSHEPFYAVVFALYQQGDQSKISRLFPGDDEPPLKIKAGHIPRFTPLSSEPLAGQDISQEALFIVASRKPLHGSALLANSVGFSAEQTIDNSVDMKAFDQALGKLDLNQVNLLVLPYAVER